MEAGIAVGVSVRAWRQSFKPSLLTLARTDLALRMRNQLAVELLDNPDEHVIDDEPVLISDASEVTKKSRGEGLPLPGWLILTNRRFIYASLADKRTNEVLLADMLLTHLEDGWATFAWRTGKTATALSVGFMPKTKVLDATIERVRVEAVLDGAGGATPGRRSQRDRIANSLSKISRRSE